MSAGLGTGLTVDELLTKRTSFRPAGYGYATLTRSQVVALMGAARQVVPVYARTTIQSDRALIRLGLTEGEPECGRVAVTPAGHAWLAAFNPTPVMRCGWFTNCGYPATGTTDHPTLGPVPTCDRHHHFARKEWRHACGQCGEPIIPGSWRMDDRRVIGHWVRPDVFERRDVPGFHEHEPS